MCWDWCYQLQKLLCPSSMDYPNYFFKTTLLKRSVVSQIESGITCKLYLLDKIENKAILEHGVTPVVIEYMSPTW